MGRLFGTDGIRGVPWNYPFTEKFIENIAYCATQVLSKEKTGNARPIVFLGMDTRGSAKRIKKALTRGFCAGRFKVVNVGIMPTPAVSYLVQKEKADFGVVISASHNPPEFNGIKFFSHDGRKLSDELENKIEELLLSDNPPSFKQAFPHLVKKDCSGEYIDFIKATLPGDFSLKGVKILIDCANGAASKVAPRLFRELGSEVELIGASPNGGNINVGCGALKTDVMAEATLKCGAFCGVCFDGDADRCLFSDEKGNPMDGDDLIAIAAPYLRDNGRLAGNGVVLTHMSNVGLVNHLRSQGINVAQVSVGDKNVTAEMEKKDFKLGGEASGHIIFREFFPTGDGLLTAVQMLRAIMSTGKKMSQLHSGWERYPQILVSQKVSSKPDFAEIPGFEDKLKEMKEKISGKGRIYIRYSGTEPLLRLLVEGKDKAGISGIADEILAFYKEKSGVAV